MRLSLTFETASFLAEHYSITPMPTGMFDYPYNIALTLWDVDRKLKDKVSGYEEITVKQEQNKTFLCCKERFDTKTSLYFIPVVPLYLALMKPERRRVAKLLLSVFAYLYHIADIPYYRQECSYLFYQYDMMKEWVLNDNDYDEEGMNNYLREFKQAEWVGDCIEKKIFNRMNLTVFNDRLKRFKGNDDIEKDCWRLASEIFKLYEEYPQATVFRNASTDGEPEYDEYEALRMDMYMSFVANNIGMVSDSLEQGLDAEFQVYSQIEEPIVIHRFDGNATSNKNLDLECRLFPLIDDLVYLLNNL